MSCGAQNTDEALFCTTCGKSLAAQPVAAPVSPAPAAPQSEQWAIPSSNLQPPPSTVYSAELRPGAHKHMPTDLYLVDPAGKTVLVAKLQSLLHKNYTIEDGVGATAGYIEGKTHLTHRTFTLQDAGHSVLSAINVSNVEVNRAPPKSWIEDGAGNRLANIVFTMGFASFSVVREDGSAILQASLSLGGGLRETVERLSSRAYSIQLSDQSFTPSMVLATVAALERA